MNVDTSKVFIPPHPIMCIPAAPPGFRFRALQENHARLNVPYIVDRVDGYPDILRMSCINTGQYFIIRKSDAALPQQADLLPDRVLPPLIMRYRRLVENTYKPIVKEIKESDFITWHSAAGYGVIEEIDDDRYTSFEFYVSSSYPSWYRTSTSVQSVLYMRKLQYEAFRIEMPQE